MTVLLNGRAWDLVDSILEAAPTLGVVPHELDCGAVIVDFGVETGWFASSGNTTGRSLHVGACGSPSDEFHKLVLSVGLLFFIETDQPVEACLLSQYAGWQIQFDDYFAMGSGPMRARAATEELFQTLGYRENFYCSVGVLETSRLPSSKVVKKIAKASRC